MPTLTDPRSAPKSVLDGLVRPLLRDERDTSLSLLALGLVPAGFALVALNYATFTWWTVVAYWVFYFWFMGPCTLGMHNIAHRPMFKNRDWDNRLIAAMGAVFGHVPGTYPSHHLAMHHREENGPEDLSSTLDYQRDSIIDFLRYWGKFQLTSLVMLSSYFRRTNRPQQLRDILAGEFGWYAMCIGLCFVHLEATICCFIAPYFATRFFLMAGNWAQHAFIDASDWDNPYRSITTFVNSGYNARCFNDGYHLNHHLRSATHWTEMPARFEEILDDIVKQDAIVFRKIDYFMIWALLMLRQHRVLARFMVDFGEETTVEQRVALLHDRLRPIEVTANVSADELAAAAE